MEIVRVVASNNAFVYDELGGSGFQLVNAESTIVSSGDEAFAAVEQQRPDLLVVDADLPGMDGYTVCKKVKEHPELKVVRVILVLQGSISSKELKRLADSGCDDVVVYRVPGDTLYHQAARLLGLPDPSLAQPVTLKVAIEGADAEPISAHATKLSTTSVDLLLKRDLDEGASLRLSLGREGGSPAVEVSGTVARVVADSATGSNLATVAFDDLSVRTRAQLADLALWDAKTLPAGVRISLRGSFDEKTDFSGIQFNGSENVIFDTSGLTLINSWGARQWIMFLRSVPQDVGFCFVNTSPVFIKHCNMVVDMLGRGSVLSFAAPYTCRACERENERILQVSSISKAIMEEPPEFRCPSCGGLEEFDEVPSRYFAFLNLK